MDDDFTHLRRPTLHRCLAVGWLQVFKLLLICCLTLWLGTYAVVIALWA